MTAPVDPRGAADFEATLRARVPGYLPGWEPTPGGAGAALLAIGARFDGIVACQDPELPGCRITR